MSVNTTGKLYICGSIEYESYEVEYYSVAEGQIAYEIIDKKTKEFVPIPSPYAEKAIEKNRNRKNNYLPKKSAIPQPALIYPSLDIWGLIYAILYFATTGNPVSVY